jgi:hypothetical protein
MSVYRSGFRVFLDSLVNWSDGFLAYVNHWSWSDFWYKDWEDGDVRGIIWNLILYASITFVLSDKAGWFGFVVAIGLIVANQWLIHYWFKETYQFFNQEEYRGSFQFSTLPRRAIRIGLMITLIVWLID